MALSIRSPKFAEGEAIPVKYTCNGDDISPPLEISGVPTEAVSLLLLFDDPDAAHEPAGMGKTFDHWIVFNIPPGNMSIPEGNVPAGSLLGENSFARQEYGGPCPPTFRHTYYFRLYALDCELALPMGATRRNIEIQMAGHLIESTTLTGVYEQPVS